ncbi:MAG: asparagine synthase (glutamine-hydrolyzing) [Sphingomicrobium sp.]
MCGIFGAVGRSLTDSALENVLHSLRHRGPDGSGAYCDQAAQLTFAHTRLAVIDLATGEQPIASDDGNIVVVCNGEIYDFERIRTSLEAKGRRFHTKSDTEVIVHLYAEFGLGCFEHLRGEFAFLLYDKAKSLLIAARDRFGIKPLYFSRLPGGFVFASEMKAIFASGLVEAKLDVAALDPLLDQDPQNARFPFEGIEHVPPASYVAIDLETSDLQMTQYWSPEIPAEAAAPVSEPFGDAPAKCAASVLQELEEAVRLRLRADVPVGLYLSGGIDSAFVAALMKRNLNTPLHSFSISFVGSGRDEREFAQRAADFVGTEHHELAVTHDMLWDHLADCLWFSELPFVSLAPIGKFLLSEEARKHVTVVLTGEGADEVFLGYRSYFEKAIRDTREGRSKRGNGFAQLRRLKLSGFGAPMVRKLSLLMLHKSRRSALTAARAKANGTPPSSKPIINAVQEARIAAMPLDILCFLGDREEMAHSLEARLPFLDHRLYDAAKSIPVDFKMRGGVEKAVLRDAARDILPDDLRLRRKSGFMLTSDAIDFFGTDREHSAPLRHHLSKEAFAQAAVFSYPAYRLVSLLARVPTLKGVPALRRLRRNSNKVMMYMMQTHMLHDMFIARPRWNSAHQSTPDLGHCRHGFAPVA